MKNEQLANAYSAARCYIESGKEICICYALAAACTADIINMDILNEATEFISDALGKYAFLQDWLVRNVDNVTFEYLKTDAGREQMRLYRLRWLDALIEEFS